MSAWKTLEILKSLFNSTTLMMKPILNFLSDEPIKERNLHLFPRTFYFLPTPRKLPSKSA